MGGFESRVRDAVSRIDNLYPGRFSIIGGDVTGGKDLTGIGQPQAGIHYADNGHYYDDPQEAIDEATSYVSLGCSNIEANLVIDTEGFTLECMSRGTAIDGDDSGPAVTVDAAGVNLKGFRCQTDNGSNSSAVLVSENGEACDIRDVTVTSSGSVGIDSTSGAAGVEVTSCRIEDSDNRAVDLAGEQSKIESVYALAGAEDGIRVEGAESEISSCYSINTGNEGIELKGDGSMAVNNTISDVADNGILVDANDCVANSNIIRNPGGDGITVRQSGHVIANNRIGGHGGAAVDTSQATNTTTDGNNTDSLS